MNTFAYRAQAPDSRLVTGIVLAASAEEALAQVRDRQLRPIDLRLHRPPIWQGVAARLQRGVRDGDKLLLLRQLQTMLGSGIPLVRALGALRAQVEDQRVGRMLGEIRTAVEGGATLAEACAHQAALFNSLQVQMVRAAEQSGLLEEMLGRMADLHEKEMEIRRNVRSAIFYPSLVIGELVLAVTVILKFVLPRFVQIFSGFGADLPLPTRMLINLSHWVDRYGWSVPLGLVALVGSYHLARRRTAFALAADRLKFKLPLVGNILHKIQLSRFSHLLASLIDAGIPLVHALRLGAETVVNVHLRRDIDSLRTEIERGGSLAAAMSERASFPPVCREMVAVGEETGRFVEALQRVSHYYDGQVDYAIKNLTVIIEPILLAVLGVVVLFVALAVFMPMWNLISVVRG